MTALPNTTIQHAQQKDTPPLYQLYFYLTEGCNLNCRHCWLSPKLDPSGKKYPTLPIELFETAIIEAKPLGLNAVKLTGGEPLLHPQFIQLLEIIRREDLELIIETNGLLCTPEIAAEIAKSPWRFVSVSLDGADAETHESIRGIPGSFGRTQCAVRNLVAADTPPQIIMSLMRTNIHQAEAVVHMAEELGAASVKFNIVQPTGRAEALHAANGLTIQELLELGRYIETDLASRTTLPLLFDTPLAFRPLSRMFTENTRGVCGILGILGVIPDGQYALCGIGEMIPELVFGKIGKDPLETVWRENHLLYMLREGLPAQLEGVCARCLMKAQCLGSCLAQNYYRTGSFWSPFWLCEQAEQGGLFPESRLITH